MNTLDLMYSRSDVNKFDIIKRMIESYTFIDYAIVSSYTDGKIDAILGHTVRGKPVKLTAIEVLTTGSKGLQISYELVEGDLVLIYSSQSFITSLTSFTKPESTGIPGYDKCSLKAMPITVEGKSTIAVDKDGNVEMLLGDVIVDAGDVVVDAKSIELNGNTKSFVTHAELATALTTLCGTLTAHVHPSIGAPAPGLVGLACDISSAKTTTIKTGG